MLLLVFVSAASLSTGGVKAGAAGRDVAATTVPRFDVLVFSGTAGFRHESIEAGVETIRRLGAAHDFAVEATEDPSVFTSDRLASYDVVVFLNTSGDVLDDDQQAGLEAYVRSGGGFAGIHGAAATEYDWSWYGDLVGAFFDNHPVPQQATVDVLDPSHPSTAGLPRAWERFDEWYNFRTNPRDDVHVLAVLEEKSYEGGTMGADHPIAWAHEFDGGRSWYTGLGHTVEGYDDPAFLDHLLGGIAWAAGVEGGDAAATMTSSYRKTVLMPDVTDPVEIGIDRRGRVFLGERSGPVMMWDPETRRTEMVGFVPVRMTIEDGLLGLTLDPDFEENGWMYIYYAPADGGPQRLARWTFDGGRLDPATEKVLLEIETQQRECCHSGGSLEFGPEGNLFLSTGDNTNPYPLGGSAMDERPGFSDGDAQRSSANTNDLRGKILRIRPLPDGTYEIPDGNLFEADSLHRPEIYTMGHRNPYRISVDAETGWLYWGDVGIGNAPSETRGPWGWEEFNQAREPGFYGWPYFAGPNDAYRDFDYATETPGPFFDPEHPINESVNNTGDRMLPPAQPATIWYTYGPSEQHPELGTGGMSAMGGPVYRYDASTASPHALPEYYDGSFFIYEWMRNWIQEVKFDENGDVLEINPFLPGMTFSRPGDMEIGPDGRVYVAEWGESFWGSNADAQVVRIDYFGADGPPASPPEGFAVLSEEPSIVTAPSSLQRSRTDASRGGDTASTHFVWPPNGGIFDYDEPIPYAVEGESDAVHVVPYSGHDTHEHRLDPVSGLSGDVVVTRTPSHVPDIHYVDRYAVVEARIAATDEDAGTNEEGGTGDVAGAGDADTDAVLDRVVLRPRILEAEHASDLTDAERHTFGKHPAEPDFADAALTVMRMEPGGTLHFTPLNLTGIDKIVLRVKPMPGGTVEIRADGPEGRLLSTVEIDSTAGDPAGDEAGGAVSAGVLYADYIDALPEGVRDTYRGWRDVRVSVSGPTEALYLHVVRSPANGTVLDVDRLEFVGPGIMKRP
ncbi:MAG: ThuA domain-containing protein [Rhodothermales bacterium]